MALAALALFGLGAGGADAEVLSGQDIAKLLAGGPEGTTIVLQGGAHKIFFSAALRNQLRRSAALGADFIRKSIQHNTVSEGVFVSDMIEGGARRLVTGIAGVAADQDSGHGVLTMIQTFPDDTTVKAFETRDRLFLVLIIEETESGIVCRRSRWEKLFAFRGNQTMTSTPCEFAVGNTIAPAGAVSR